GPSTGRTLLAVGKRAPGGCLTPAFARAGSFRSSTNSQGKSLAENLRRSRPEISSFSDAAPPGRPRWAPPSAGGKLCGAGENDAIVNFCEAAGRGGPILGAHHDVTPPADRQRLPIAGRHIAAHVIHD